MLSGAAGRYGAGSPSKATGGRVLGYAGGKGNVLGRKDDREGDRDRLGRVGEGEGKEGEVRQPSSSKVEADKKNLKRLAVLEKRLQSQVDEVADLTGQLKRARETAQNALTAKEEMSKRLTLSSRLTQDTKKASLEDIGELEESRSKIFSLEDENSRLLRRVEVELPNEVCEQRHVCASINESFYEHRCDRANMCSSTLTLTRLYLTNPPPLPSLRPLPLPIPPPPHLHHLPPPHSPSPSPHCTG